MTDFGSSCDNVDTKNVNSSELETNRLFEQAAVVASIGRSCQFLARSQLFHCLCRYLITRSSSGVFESVREVIKQTNCSYFALNHDPDGVDIVKTASKDRFQLEHSDCAPIS